MMLQTVVLLEPLAAGSAPDRVAAGGHHRAGEEHGRQQESKRLAASMRHVAHIGMAACAIACVSRAASLIVAHIKPSSKPEQVRKPVVQQLAQSLS